MSSTVTFTRVADNEARIHDADDDHVGDLFRHPDILRSGQSTYYVIHLSEDPRGPVRVHERSRIREVAAASPPTRTPFDRRDAGKENRRNGGRAWGENCHVE